MKNLFLFLLVFIFFSSFWSCNKNELITETQPTIVTMKTPLHFLALGDSYTIGESVPENKRWPVQLAAKLSENGIPINAPKIIAKTGWTTDELKQAIKEENIQETYDLVSLLIGVNNQYRGVEKGYTLSAYRNEYRELLTTAIAFADGNPQRVIVVSIPDYSVTPFAANSDTDHIHRELRAYNTTKREISTKMGVHFFDITPISLEAKNNLSLIANDHLHPSGEMYTRWVNEVIYVQTQRLLQE